MAWNVRRREVLGGAALGIAAAGFGLGKAHAASGLQRVTLVEETSIPESRHFAQAFAEAGHPARIIRIDRSLNGLLDELADAEGLMIGLTSDPAAMIAGQLLAERGAQPRLQWKHVYQDGRWQHRTHGMSGLLEKTRAAWPGALAHQLRGALAGNHAGDTALCRSGACDLAAGSPGMLVSWAIDVGGRIS